MDIFHKLKQERQLNNLSTSVLAAYLLEYKGDYNELSIKKLCLDAKVSYATPTRLAQKMGYDGFAQLKYTLTSVKHQGDKTVFNSPGLNIQEYRDKLNKSLDKSFQNITESDITQLAKLFIKYDRIKIYGVGQGNHLGKNIEARMIRFNKLPMCPSNESEIFTSSRLANKNDLVVAISYSARTPTIMEPLEHCYNNGVTTILFTANGDVQVKASKVVALNLSEVDVSNYSMISKIVLEIIFDFIYIKMIELNEEYRQYLILTSMRK